MASQEELKEAFIAGYRACLYAYAVHRDGELQVGVMRKPYRAVRDAVPEDAMAMADLAMFLGGRDREDPDPSVFECEQCGAFPLPLEQQSPREFVCDDCYRGPRRVRS